MKIITISGVDGSGKSTQIKKIYTYLSERGEKVYYFHAIEFSIAQNFLKSSKKKFIPGHEKAITKANFFSIFLRKISLCIDIFRFFFFIRYLHLRGFTYLISDRYFYDSLINIYYLSYKKSNTFFERLIPQPDYAFFMKILPEKIMQRDRIPEQGIEYLKKKTILFLEKQKIFNLISLNADSLPEVIFADILIKIKTNV